MKRNLASWDRTLRSVLGIGLLGLTVVGPQTWWGLLGIVSLATALTGSCPLYALLGLRTGPAAAPPGSIGSILVILATVGAAGALAGCDGATSSPVAPTTPVPTATATLTPEVLSALEQGIQDEYKAEAMYQAITDDFGLVAPFVNILTAEQRHSAAIGQIFIDRSLAVPPSRWTVDNVPRFATLAEACRAGVVAEQQNIAMYEALLRLDLPTDVQQVFTNNQRASQVNHLPAFQACS